MHVDTLTLTLTLQRIESKSDGTCVSFFNLKGSRPAGQQPCGMGGATAEKLLHINLLLLGLRPDEYAVRKLWASNVLCALGCVCVCVCGASEMGLVSGRRASTCCGR
jgi:hypothetical protein